MLQKHSMIIWAKARNEDFKSIVYRTYNLLTALKDFGVELSPNYLTVGRKENAKPFDLTYEALEKVLEKSVNKGVNCEFPELGRRIGFFSSLINADSAGISMLIGVTNSRFKNTLVLNLPITLPIYSNNLVVQKIIKTFKNCVELFDPFWGCIGNNVNAKRYNGYWSDSLPTTIHWVNYFGENIVGQIGMEKIEKAPVFFVESLSKGYFIRIKEFPLDDSSEIDISLQKDLNKYLYL